MNLVKKIGSLFLVLLLVIGTLSIRPTDIVYAASPTATSIVVADTALRMGETSLVTITFSEAVKDFDNEDLIIPNGVLSTVSSSDGGSTWTATFTPTAGVTATTNVITLDNTGVQNVSGNAGTGTTSSDNYAIDTQRPTATSIVVADTALSIGKTSTVTITFSEAVTGFTNADLTFQNGFLSTVTSSDGGITWTATFTPTASITAPTNVITLANTGVADLAGNAGTGTTDSGNYAIDTKRPTATSIVVADTALSIGDTSTVTITFSEPVTGFTLADLTIPNGVLSTVTSSDGGITWTATFTPDSNTTAPSNVITLANTGVADLAGNAGTGTTDLGNYAIDTKRPTATSIVVADTALRMGETSTVTITFSEPVTGFSHADLTVQNGFLSTVTSSDGGITWTATFTPTASITAPTNVITLANTGVADLAGNAGTGTTDSGNYAIDTKRPTATSIVVADTALSIGDTSTVTITFSEPVTGFTLADLTIPNGVLSTVTSSDGGITWTATFTPTAGVTATTNVITLDNTGVQNVSGNAGTGTTNSGNYAIDTKRPTATSIVVADTALSIGKTSTVTITFSEVVRGFDNADLTIRNGTLSAVSSSDGGITWTATFTPTANITDATNVITLNNSSVLDASGNAGTGTTISNNYAIDTQRPTAVGIVLSPKTKSITVGETTAFTVNEQFSDGTTENQTVDAKFTVDNSAIAKMKDNVLTAITPGTVTVTATYGSSSDTATITVNAAPSVPTNVTGTAGNGQATVNFNAPASNGGSAITGYTVKVYAGGVEQTSLAKTGTASPITVTGLTNGTAYTFKVLATNSIGSSAESVASAAVTPEAPATAPSVPTNVTGTAGNGQATVNFNAPTSTGGSAITGYTVKVYAGGVEQTPLAKTGTASPITVTGLTNGTAYTFKVLATNSIGSSAESVASAAVTPEAPAPTPTPEVPPPATAPSVPTNVTGTAGNGQATVNFNAPASNGGSAITGYTVKVYAGGVEQTSLAKTDASPITVTGLTNGTAYTFKVVATNSIGSSVESVASAAVTPEAPATAPSVPTNVTGTAGNGQATVNFNAPASNGGSAITGYTVKVYAGGVEQTSLAKTDAASPITVTGLTNGTAYTFKVVATNSIGNSAESVASAAVTPEAPATAPSVPTNVTGTAGNGQVTVNFDAPASTGGSAITGYTVKVYAGGVEQTSLARTGRTSPITVTGLTNGTAYTFKVVATNSIGSSAESVASVAVTPEAPVPPVPPVPQVTPVTPVTPTTNTEQIAIDVVDAKNPNTVIAQTVIIRTTENGVVKDTVNLTLEKVLETIRKLVGQEQKDLRIVLPNQPNSKETVINVPQQAISALTEGQTSLSISSESSSILIPYTSFEMWKNDLYFRIMPVKEMAQKGTIQSSAMQNQQVQDIVTNTATITVLGNPVTIETNLQNRPVTITLPIPADATDEQIASLVVYIEHSDGSTEVKRGRITEFSPGVRGVEFDVEHFSTFTLLNVPDLKEDEPTTETDVVAPYIQGYADGSFRPNTSVTRAQMATMLARHLTNGMIPTAEATFEDIAKNPSKDAIEFVKQTGVFNGTSETTFNPNGMVTRAQMAGVVARWIEKICIQDESKPYCAPVGQGKVFTDVNKNHWAASAIERVSALGIMSGTSATTFNPNGSLTRAQAVKVLNQLFERPGVENITESTFRDVPASHWAIGEIEAAATEMMIKR